MSYWTELPEGLDPAQRQLVEELRALKDGQRLSLNQLERLTHYSRASWHRWLNGQRPVTVEAVRALVTGLGMDGARLLTLCAGADPAAPRQAGAAVAPVAVGPAQLPADLPDFAGRQRVVEDLRELLRPGGGPSRPVVISAVSGLGGIGKTALAVRVGRRLLADYPDGQFYVNLRGSVGIPRSAAEVLAGLLRDLGEPAGAIPPEEDARSARFRSLTSGRRLLIVLDDARDAAQVRPLLPGSGSCAVLVTSRRRLPGLAGAVPVHLDVLEPAEALELFASVVGAERVRAEPAAVEEVLGYCGGLPLAVRIAASRLASRPGWTVAALAGRLADERRRLDELNVEDVAVRAVFRTSFAALAPAGPGSGPGPARAFGLLGLFPGQEFDLRAAAALLDEPLGTTDRLLETLTDACLLEAVSAERFRMHDLLRVFAEELADEQLSADQRAAARRRLTGWYLYACHQAGRRLVAAPRDYPIDGVARCEPAIDFPGQREALAWLDRERSAVLDVVRLACADGLGAAAWLIPLKCVDYYHLRGHSEDWAEAFMAAAAAARGQELETHLLHGSVIALLRLRRPAEALVLAQVSMGLLRERGKHESLLKGTALLAEVLCDLRRYEEALPLYEEAVAGYRAGDDVVELVGVVGNSALIFYNAGRHEEARARSQEALELAREHGMRFHEGLILGHLGQAELALGHVPQALGALSEAVPILREIGNESGAAEVMEVYGNALRAAGRTDRARAAWAEAEQWFAAAGSPRAVAIRAKLAAADQPAAADHRAGHPA
ncbi:ATP-binding protein [Kitasatospora viridis]|uniref:Tetratricopeptide repeat protein n=1 Tax=Kitasatospora viridis TaxID=281105 RepID=A0A561SE74_9ACTN|nr:XRE family transcriptional regulator [Kitasatospora viridis]TWF73148.1 tetratricopeptide repeat protein [Kitasatospora viridis]